MEQHGAIFDKFDLLVCNGDEDTMPKMLQKVKKHVARTWDQMKTTNMKMVAASVAEPTCGVLQDTLIEKVLSVDPEEDLPTGQEILKDHPPQPLAVEHHSVSLFENLMVAMGYLSSAYVNLTALAKSCNGETFRTILKASVRLLVQINIPPKFLNPYTRGKTGDGGQSIPG